jgi:flagellar hook-length control protein FliK
VQAAQLQQRQPDPATSAAPVHARPEAAPLPEPVPLHRLHEAAGTAIRLAVRDGHAVARINVHPAELGSVEIKLHFGPRGALTAEVSADSQQAAQALLGAGGELRRTLEAQGLTLERLDVRYGDEYREPGRGQGPWREEPDHRRSSTGRFLFEGEPEVAIEASSLPPALGRVDVLA